MTSAAVGTPDAGTPGAGTPVSAPATRSAGGGRSRMRRADLAVLGCYALLTGWLFGRLLVDVRGRYLTDSTSDQRLFEYYLSWVARALTHGQNPLVIPLQNAPAGVNGMGNTIVLALSAPLTPVTLAFGAPVSFALAMALGVTASAWCWYWLFSRFLPVAARSAGSLRVESGAGAAVPEGGGAPGFSRVAAAVGGGLVAFGPTMVSHANGHVNMVVNFALPLIIGLTLRLREPGHAVRRGLLLGLCAVVQVMIGAEILLIAALGFGVLLLAYGAQRPAAIRAAWRPVVAGLGLALAVAVPLLAYPLWVQFAGPQHYSGLPFSRFGFADVLSYPSFATRSLAATGPAHYAKGNLTEENGYLGWPLLLLAVALAAWLWRSALVRAAAVTALLFAILSLGNRVHVAGHATPLPGPWRLPARLPLLENIIPSRLAYVTVAMVALLVALGIDRTLALPVDVRVRRLPARVLWLTLITAALVPILPTPLPAGTRTPVPAFFTDGTWRRYLDENATVVPVPLPRSPVNTYAFDWQIAADLRFRVAGGYFVGPWPADRYGPAGHGWYDQFPRPTDQLLMQVQPTGPVPPVTDTDRANARDDLRYWHAEALVLDPLTAPQPAALKQLVDQLTGVTGVYVDGVWLWNVRPISGA